MRKPRVNNKIRSNEVQLITHEGENIGVVPIGEAINRAQEVGLDLIEIAPNVKPPVCKIIDYGKYKYELQKKASHAKKKQKIINLKEIKLRPSTDKHDYDFKIKAADKFLVKGDKVKFTSSKTGVTKTGILTKVKIKRALVMVKGEGNWDVPLSMLEVA